MISLFMGLFILHSQSVPILTEEEFTADSTYLLNSAKQVAPILGDQIFLLVFEAALPALMYMPYDS